LLSSAPALAPPNLLHRRLLGRVFALDFSLFTLAMALAVWLTGVGLDQMAVTPRQISLILATGSLFPNADEPQPNRGIDRTFGKIYRIKF
jgi:hypothetical protein